MYLNFLEAAGNGGNAAAAGGGGLFSIVIMLAPMLLIFYFMLIRPEKKRKKEAEALRNALKEGDKITTIGGLTGVIVNIKENTFVIERMIYS